MNSSNVIKRKHLAHQSTNVESKIANSNSEKRMRLRKHFPNYYNQLFDEFSVKKMRHLEEKGDGGSMVLFDLKVKRGSLPEMGEIHRKLREERWRRMRRYPLQAKEEAVWVTQPKVN